METTDTPWAVGGAALAHALGNSVQQAYACSDLFERRRALMQQWANYAASWLWATSRPSSTALVLVDAAMRRVACR